MDTRRGRTSRRPGRAGHGAGWRQFLVLAIMQGERRQASFLHGDSRHETDEFRCSSREDELEDDTTEDVLEELLWIKTKPRRISLCQHGGVKYSARLYGRKGGASPHRWKLLRRVKLSLALLCLLYPGYLEYLAHLSALNIRGRPSAEGFDA